MMDDRMDRTIEEAAAEYHRPPEAPREAMWERVEAARRLGGSAARRPAGSAPRVIPLRRPMRIAVPVGIAALLALAFGLGRVSVDRTEGPVAAAHVDSAVGAAPDATVPDLRTGGTSAPSQMADAAGTDDSAGAPGRPDATDAAPELELRSAPRGAPPRALELAGGRGAGPGSGDTSAAREGGRAPASAPGRGQEPPASAALALAAREHLAQAETFLSLFRASVNSGDPIEPIVPQTARYLLASNRLLLDSPAADDPAMRRLLGDVELVLAQIAQFPADSAAPADEELITQGIEERDLLLRIRTAADDGGRPNEGVL